MKEEKPRVSLCDSCVHLLHIKGDGFESRKCDASTWTIELHDKVYVCSRHTRKNTMNMYAMEKLAYVPDEDGHWKKPDKKAGFYIEEPV